MLKETGPLLLLGLLFSGLSLFLQYRTAHNTLHIELETDTTGVLQVLWKKDGQEYSPERSSKHRIENGKKERISSDLPPFSEVDHLTVFPINRKANIRISELSLKHHGIVQLNLLDSNVLQTLERKNNLAVTFEETTTASVTIHGDRAFFEIPINKIPLNTKWLLMALVGLFLALIIFHLFSRSNCIKGGKDEGMLLIRLPATVTPNLQNVNRLTGGYMIQEVSDDFVRYHRYLPSITEQTVQALLRQVKEDNPQADVFIQFNRSGECG